MFASVLAVLFTFSHTVNAANANDQGTAETQTHSTQNFAMRIFVLIITILPTVSKVAI